LYHMTLQPSPELAAILKCDITLDKSENWGFLRNNKYWHCAMAVSTYLKLHYRSMT
jgi:hypothetical protein